MVRLANVDGQWKVVERIPRMYETIKPVALTERMLHGWVDSSQIPPPLRRALRVTVRDSLTGAPIRAFGVSIQATPVTKAGFPDDSKFPSPWGKFFTNAKGEVVISNPPRSDIHIEAQCPPSGEVQGATLGDVALMRGVGLDTTINFRVRPHACVELAPAMAAEAAKHKEDVERAKVEAAARADAGNLWGVLRDAKTGKPVPLARMRMDVTGGIASTDSAGRFWLWGFAPGSHKIAIYCPVRRQLLGRVATNYPFYARPAMKDTMDISAPMDHCTDVPVDTVHVRTKGVWSTGFEDNFFTPCKPFTQIDLGGYRNYGLAWVTFAKSGLAPKGGWPETAPKNGSSRTFIDVEADLIGPGSYGHMGVGTFVLRITRVLSARATDKEQCS
jgi:hypothetical protein